MARLFRRVTNEPVGQQPHHQHDCGGDEEHPLPWKDRDRDTADDENERPSSLNHRPEDRRKCSPLANVEPAGIYLDERERTVGLKVRVQRPRRGKVPKKERARSKHAQICAEPESDIEDNGSKHSDEHGPPAAYLIGDESIKKRRESVDGQCGCDDRPDLSFVPAECVGERFVRERKIVPAHVHCRVGQSECQPVQSAPAPEVRAMNRTAPIRRTSCPSRSTPPPRRGWRAHPPRRAPSSAAHPTSSASIAWCRRWARAKACATR